jgi:hypothetical protein
MEQVEAAACLGLLEFLKSKHSELYGIFAGSAMDTLDPTMQLAYQEVISQPRDLEMIRAKIKQGFYHTMDDFKADMHLCFDNSQLFCGMYPQFKHVVDLAKKTKDIFNKKYTTEAKAAAKKVTSGAGGGAAGGRSGTRAAAAARPSIHGHEATILEKIIKPIRNEPGCALLLHPVPKSAPFYEHYSMRISHPMDFDTLQANVMSTAAGGAGATKALGFGSNDKVDPTAQYEYVDEFVKDARRIFSNAIRYNCYLDKSSTALRRTFTSLLYKFEARLLEWNRKNFPNDAILPPTPPLKLCLSAIEGAFQTLTCNPNVSTEVPVSAVGSFIDPVSVQLDKDTLKAYLGAVGTPMDFGTIIEKLIGGLYPSTAAFTSDVQQVKANCVTYWSGREAEGGGIYMQDAQAVADGVNSLINTNPQRLGEMPELPKAAVRILLYYCSSFLSLFCDVSVSLLPIYYCLSAFSDTTRRLTVPPLPQSIINRSQYSLTYYLTGTGLIRGGGGRAVRLRQWRRRRRWF